MLAPLIRLRSGEEIIVQVINRTAQSRAQHFTPGQAFKDCEIRNCQECIDGDRIMQRYTFTVFVPEEQGVATIDVPFATYREILSNVGDPLEPISEPIRISREPSRSGTTLPVKFVVRLVN